MYMPPHAAEIQRFGSARTLDDQCDTWRGGGGGGGAGAGELLLMRSCEPDSISGEMNEHLTQQQ